MSYNFILPITNSGWINVDINGNEIGARIGGGGPLIDIISAKKDIRPTKKSDNSPSIAKRALDDARNVAEGELKKGANIVKNVLMDVVTDAATNNVFARGIGMAADTLGINPFGGDGCGIICELQKWIEESGIFQRLALALLAFIFIGVALAMLGRGSVVETVVKQVKG